jgi:hypothetical protein
MIPKRTRDKLGRYQKMRMTWKPPKDCMSCEEIRFWLGELRYRHGYGWLSLCRVLGVQLKNDSRLRRKADGRSWIYPTEQTRWSAVLKRIISGELKYVPPVMLPGKFVLADHPVPLVQPLRMNFDFRTGKVTQRSRLELPAPTLPSFRTLLERSP